MESAPGRSILAHPSWAPGELEPAGNGESWEWEPAGNAGSGAMGSEGLFVLGAAAIPAEIMDVHRWDWASSPSLVGTACPELGLLSGTFQGPFCALGTALTALAEVFRCSDLGGFPFPSYPELTPGNFVKILQLK